MPDADRHLRSLAVESVFGTEPRVPGYAFPTFDAYSRPRWAASIATRGTLDRLVGGAT